jgi:hypothetical protein
MLLLSRAKTSTKLLLLDHHNNTIMTTLSPRPVQPDPCVAVPPDNLQTRVRMQFRTHGLPTKTYAYTCRVRSNSGKPIAEGNMRVATDPSFVMEALHYGYQMELRSVCKPARFVWLQWRQLEHITRECLAEQYDSLSFYSLPLDYVCDAGQWYQRLEKLLEES